MSSSRPNFLVIVADDLGYSDIGCYGGEIETPNLDKLAQENGAIRFTDFHVAAACSPTRAMLMSGTDSHLAGSGQLMGYVAESPAHQGYPGNEGYLRENIAALPEVLKAGGYHTMMAGKWHLGLRPEQAPVKRGFERAFAHLPGCGNHYGYEPQLEYENDIPEGFRLATPLHMEGQDYIENRDLPEGYYSTDYYTDRLLKYLDERPKDKPFFAYLPFTAPHWPLQAPRRNIEKYNGVYEDGPGALRARRLKRQVELGLLEKGVEPHPVVKFPTSLEWEEMDDKQKAKSARAMQAYAGMVDRIDENLGRVFDKLKEQGLFDNCVIIFQSDNGPDGASVEAKPVIQSDSVVDHVAKYYNNSLDNIGNYDSFVWYGNLWAQASTAPSRLFKLYSTEGGCRVPFIYKGLGNGKACISKEYCTVMDIMPTFLDYSGIPKPAPVFEGREVLDMRGESMLPFLKGEKEHIHSEEYVTGWEFEGQGALRKGKWKINFVAKPIGPEKWQLYDLEKDPGEIHDLAQEHPEKLKELVEDWEEYARTSFVVGLRPQVAEMNARDEMQDTTNWMKYESSFDILRELEAKRGEVRYPPGAAHA